MTCAIRWVDKEHGVTPPPDGKPMAYIAVSKHPSRPDRAFPCCQEHYLKGKHYPNWDFIDARDLVTDIKYHIAYHIYKLLSGE